MSVILGVDPGSRKTGFGLIASVAGRHRYIASGVIRIPDVAFPERLKIIFDSLTEVIDLHRPVQVAIEEVFMARSAGSALKLGQARGAAMVACAQRELAVAEYTARQIKQAVTGTGAATKEQVQHMVTTLLKLPATPQEDAADALAAAICHAHTRQGLQGLVGQLPARARLRRGRIA
ncbi:MAG: crossover junction endodeoxyribonuclease RuvC [Spongiibacteraceae bacterium]|jgi:crossover junction endodeoxyribonuclease RuvC|nr:crossover junction endodeoxyribonuclease RuvC [Spongiibacteraceae bacterium]